MTRGFIGVWKRILNNKGENVSCRKCGKIIPTKTWFYTRISGQRHKKRVPYCESCFKSLWI